ncbi:MAG: hypothetical protein QOH61_1572 [Chloroflexota bacterium]|jgi:ELWxxDGT repeat protein|nr:hypothetical protein [Chloroflexota bacterium]
MTPGFAIHGIRALVAGRGRALAVLASVALLAPASPAAAGGSPVLVKTIQTYTEDAIYNSGSSGFLRFSDTLVYFMADDGAHGAELWKTDGTAAGTTMVKDIVPGILGSAPEQLTKIGSTLYFVATTDSGQEVWKTNGTSAGTVQVSDRTGDSSQPRDLTALGTKLVYEAYANAGPFRHIFSYAGSGSPSEIAVGRGPLAVLGSYVYYEGAATGSQAPYTLWRSNGTSAAEYDADVKFYDFVTYYEPKVVVGGTLYVVADDGTAGPSGLWKAGGTPGDATPVHDQANQVIHNAGALAVAGGKLYFDVYDGTETVPWVSNGTNAGTGRLGDPTGALTNQPYVPARFVSLGSNVYFTAGDGLHGAGLWKSTGSPGNLTKVKFPGTDNGGYIAGLVAAKGRLYFSFNDGSARKHALYKSDGTPGGTAIAKDFGKNGAVNEISVRSTAGATPKLLLAGRDAAHGLEPWGSDGTSGGTKLLKDVNAHTVGSQPLELTAFQGKLYFGATVRRNDSNLFSSTGTGAGTSLVKTFGTRSEAPQDLTVVGARLFFAGFDALGWNLWKSDGTKAGTVRVKDLRPGNSGGTAPHGLLAFGGKLYFTFDDGSKGAELWTSDGTSAGTKRVKDIWPGANGSLGYATKLVAMGDRFYFSADDGVKGQELWKSDGTSANTVRVTDLAPNGASSFPGDLTSLGGRLYFTASPSLTGLGVYWTQGTGQTEIYAPYQYPGFLTPFGGNLYFQGHDAVHNEEVWKSVAGGAATRLTDIPGTFVQQLKASGSALYFTADDGTNGVELWQTDGVDPSAAGTHIVANIRPGADPSYPAALTDVNGVLYFTADDGTHGPEPWRTTGSGVEMVADINPAYGSVDSGTEFVLVGSNLYFAASNWGNGTARELWKIPVP